MVLIQAEMVLMVITFGSYFGLEPVVVVVLLRRLEIMELMQLMKMELLHQLAEEMEEMEGLLFHKVMEVQEFHQVVEVEVQREIMGRLELEETVQMVGLLFVYGQLQIIQM